MNTFEIDNKGICRKIEDQQIGENGIRITFGHNVSPAAAFRLRELIKSTLALDPQSRLRHRVTGAIERDEAELDPVTFRASRCASPEGQAVTERLYGKEFTVITVSKNANSFGYKSVLCLAEDGEGIELLIQAYGTHKLPVPGDKVRKDDPRGYGQPRQLPKITSASAAKILKGVKP